uniref:Uncharacterized protein n=1 Tax=Rhizophora mucronata TaxID=61149 RepID=A0A2P2N0J1_RHIMU
MINIIHALVLIVLIFGTAIGVLDSLFPLQNQI